MDQNNRSTRIVFEDEDLQRHRESFQTSTPKIVRWVIKYSGGIINDEKQANYFLIGFVVVAVIISLFLLFGGENNRISSPDSDLINSPQPLGEYIPR